jgi:hypothetical protein
MINIQIIREDDLANSILKSSQLISDEHTLESAIIDT